MISSACRIALLASLLCAPIPATAADFFTSILDPERASAVDDQLELRPTVDSVRVLSPHPIIFQAAPGESISTPGGVEFSLTASAPGEVEFHLIYDGQTGFLPLRRSYNAGLNRIRMEVPRADRLTTFTLNARSASGDAVRIDNLYTTSFQPRALAWRIAGYRPQPLVARHATGHDGKGNAEFLLYFPPDIRPRLAGTQTEIEFRGAAGETARAPFRVSFPPAADLPMDRESLTVPWPEFMTDGGTVRLLLTDADGRERDGATINLATTALAPATLEVPHRSIEDFSALVRNGELIVYTGVTDEGALPGSPAAPAIVELVMLNAGDGISWTTQEPVLRTRRDAAQLYGGPHSFSAATFGNVTYAMYSVAAGGGGDTLHTAMGANSLRLNASAQNPVWPMGIDESIPFAAWRGNAIFQVKDYPVLLAVETMPDGHSQWRHMLSEVPWRWLDLGAPAIDESPDGVRWLTSYTDGGSNLLLMGPEIRLLRSDNPLRSWSPVAFMGLQESEKAQLLEWNQALHLFRITRINGRGVVTWSEVRATAEGYEFISPERIPDEN